MRQLLFFLAFLGLISCNKARLKEQIHTFFASERKVKTPPSDLPDLSFYRVINVQDDVAILHAADRNTQKLLTYYFKKDTNLGFLPISVATADTAKLADGLRVGFRRNKQLAGMRVYWLKINHNKKYHQLIVIDKNDRNSLKHVSLSSVDKIKSTIYEHSYVAFKFSRKYAEQWRKFTKENIGRCVAVLINDKLVMAPRVMTEIEGGNCSISSDNADELKEICTQLNMLVE